MVNTCKDGLPAPVRRKRMIQNIDSLLELLPIVQRDLMATFDSEEPKKKRIKFRGLSPKEKSETSNHDVIVIEIDDSNSPKQSETLPKEDEQTVLSQISDGE